MKHKSIYFILVSLLLYFLIIPVTAYTVGNGGSVWAGNSTMNNVTEDYGDHNVKIGIFDDNFEEKNLVTSGNLTIWHDAGAGNETYQIDVNAITPANTNYTVWYRQNGTGEFVQVVGVYTDNKTIALSPGYQNTDVRIVLNGNETATPELIYIRFYTQPESTAPSYGVSLTNISALTNTTPTGANATYLLNLINTGTAPDFYNVTIDNANNACVGLNLLTPYSLNTGETKIFMLNVTSDTPGTFSVNVTAESHNDPTKIGYINTTTHVETLVGIPAIASWNNNKTNDDATSLTIYINEAVMFNATANQSIAAWVWSKDGVLQDNNYDNFSTSWSTPGVKTASVHAVNENGTSNILTWTVSVIIKINPVELPKLSKTAPYSDIPVQGIANWGSTDREFIQAGHNDRIKQNGTIYQIRFAVADASKLTQFYFTVWRKSGSNYDRIATTDNLINNISDGINVINLTHPIENIQEGDFYGYRIKASADGLYVDTGVTNHKTYYINGGATSFENYNWMANPFSSYVFVIEPYMENTYMVFIGDSIMSGVTTWIDTHYSFIDNVDFTNIPVSIENQWTRKVDRSYQNMGIAGDMISGINSRFNSDVVDLSPEFVLIEGGINDVNAGNSNDLILANWNSMIQKAYNNNVTPVIMLILPDSRASDTTASKIDYLNEELIQMSTNYSPSIVVDARCYIGTYREGGPLGNYWDINPSYTWDGLHYNALGTERIAQAIKDSFKYIYGKPGLYNFVQSDGTVLYSMNLSYAKNTSWRMASTSGAANVSYNTPSPGELASITINSGTIDWFNIGNISSNLSCYLIDSNGITIESKGPVNQIVNFTTDLSVGSYRVQCSDSTPPPSDGDSNGSDSSNGGSSDGGSSSSGESGFSSGENFYNIVLSETDRQTIFKNSSISFNFKLEGNIIQCINFTALNSSGTIAAKVEILNNTSTLVTTPPPHEVFKNLNIWIGNHSWATEKNMADTTVSFMVEKSWITDNDIDETTIALYCYRNDNWDKLVTRKVAEDSNKLYFKAETSGFTSFTVSGKKTMGEPGGEGIIAEPTVTVEKKPIPTPTVEKEMPGFDLFAGLSVLLIAVQLMRKWK